MRAYDAEPWTDFAVALAGAAAALTGLLFVAVSINLQVILAQARSPARAGQALVLLVTPVFLSLAVLVPGQATTALGLELIAVGVAAGSILGWLCRPGGRSPEQPLASWLTASVTPAVGLSLGAALAGVGVLTESLGGLYWLPVAVALGLVGGLLNAWVLLIEILR